MKRRAPSPSRAARGDGRAVDRGQLERRRQRSDQREARRVADLGDLRAADRARSSAPASSRIAVAPFGERAQARRRPRRAMPSRCSTDAKWMPAVDSARIGEVDRARGEQRGLQRLGVVDRRRRRRRSHRDRRCARGRARAACRRAARRSPAARAIMASVTIITSQGAPASSASFIAPTAPKRRLHAQRRWRLRSRACSACTQALARRRRRGRSARRSCRRARRRHHWSALAPEILTMRAHLTMSSFR